MPRPCQPWVRVSGDPQLRPFPCFFWGETWARKLLFCTSFLSCEGQRSWGDESTLALLETAAERIREEWSPLLSLFGLGATGFATWKTEFFLE